ncbi:hypothetical protein ACVMH6_000880 [Rhizobium leguminosarum]
MLGDNVAAAKRPMQRRDSASTEKQDTRTSRGKDSLNSAGHKMRRVLRVEFPFLLEQK